MRKVIQISLVPGNGFSSLVVLCDDGAVLQYSPRQSPPWTRFPSVPAPEVQLDLVQSVSHTEVIEIEPVPQDEEGEEHA